MMNANNIAVLYDESEMVYRGIAIFPTTEEKNSFIAEWETFKEEWRNALTEHEENDDDFGEEWFDDNRYDVEEFDTIASKHNGKFFDFEDAWLHIVDIVEL